MEELKNLGLDPNLCERIGTWLVEPYDKETREGVRALIQAKDVVSLTDAFYRDLEFGTGGLRGIVGVGTNRMNRFTVARATQGFSNYLKKHANGEPLKVAISFDSRNMSKEFAQLTAEVFASNGIDVYLFAALRPTPVLSFAIRHLGCQGGVMLTASHNPKEYNGYKAYGADGGQLVAPHDKGVIQEVLAISNPSQIPVLCKSSSASTSGTQRTTSNTTNSGYGHITLLGESLDQAYIEACKQLSIRPEVVGDQRDIAMVFSPIHGTGITLVPALLQAWGFTNLSIVEEQEQPDGNFPTVIYPNPEEAEAMTLAIQEAKRLNAELAMATDPDADRVGLAIRVSEGEYQLLNGNEIGSLLVDYVLSAKQEKGALQDGDYVCKTIVTTNLIADIANAYHVPCEEVLTGFKYIGELITQRSQQNQTFLVGGEESFGYLIGELVRDKDAVLSCAFIAEMAAYHRSKGRSLKDALIELYMKHGFYKEKLISLTKQGKSGAEAIQRMMQKLRQDPPLSLGDIAVAQLNDYQRGVSLDLKSGEKTSLTLPTSDVLQFVTVQGDVVSIRPSGTEPKIKFYCSAKETLANAADFDQTEQALNAKIDSIMASLTKFAEE